MGAVAEYDPCAECKGAGRIGAGYLREDCPACNGTGKAMSAGAVKYVAPRKLTSGNKAILRLIRKGAAGADGWAPVSRIVAPLFATNAMEPIPSELFEFEPLAEGRGRVRLTEKGESILDAAVYL